MTDYTILIFLVSEDLETQTFLSDYVLSHIGSDETDSDKMKVVRRNGILINLLKKGLYSFFLRRNRIGIEVSKGVVKVP